MSFATLLRWAVCLDVTDDQMGKRVHGRVSLHSLCGHWALGVPVLVAVWAMGGTGFLPPKNVRRAPTPPTRLTIERSLLGKLQTLASGLRIEIVLCLEGSARGDELVLTGFSMPDPEIAASTRASVGPCPANTAAVWHNHPLPEADATMPALRPRGEPLHQARELCQLSRSDIATTVSHGYPYIVVSVDAETWCWWSLDQIKHFARQGLSVGPPVRDQVSWNEPVALLP